MSWNISLESSLAFFINSPVAPSIFQPPSFSSLLFFLFVLLHFLIHILIQNSILPLIPIIGTVSILAHIQNNCNQKNNNVICPLHLVPQGRTLLSHMGLCSIFIALILITQRRFILRVSMVFKGHSMLLPISLLDSSHMGVGNGYRIYHQRMLIRNMMKLQGIEWKWTTRKHCFIHYISFHSIYISISIRFQCISISFGIFSV